MGELEEIATSYGASTQAVQTTLEHLASRQEHSECFVCIAHVDGNHFVNIADIDDRSVWIVDPPNEGMIAEPLFSHRWAGNALLLSREPLIPELDLRLSRPWKWWLGAAAVMLTVVMLMLSWFSGKWNSVELGFVG